MYLSDTPPEGDKGGRFLNFGPLYRKVYAFFIDRRGEGDYNNCIKINNTHKTQHTHRINSRERRYHHDYSGLPRPETNL